MSGEQKTLMEVLTQEMRLRNYSDKTLKAYKSALRSFIKYFSPRHPRELTTEDIRTYLFHLLEDEKFAAATVNQTFNALRFLYVDLYKMPFT
jgi:site-specific recombinase XerD